jgi:hypothetical protein
MVGQQRYHEPAIQVTPSHYAVVNVIVTLKPNQPLSPTRRLQDHESVDGCDLPVATHVHGGKRYGVTRGRIAGYKLLYLLGFIINV